MIGEVETVSIKHVLDKAVKTPIPSGGWGWAVVDEEEIQAVTEVLQNPHKLFRYRGQEHTQCSLFEAELKDRLGVKHALFVNSGTSALTCCLAGFGIGPGDEVIVPAYTYIATAAAVVNVGAVPIIAEIDATLGLCPADVISKMTPYTKAIIPVHMQGVPARLAKLRKIAKDHGLILIEDSCQAIGSKYQGEFTGVSSDAFAWSMNYYKVLTCGEGGVFFTNDDEAFLKGVYQSDPGTPMWDSNLKSGATVPPFSRGGYRGNEISAAMARVQFKKMDQILGHTRRLKKTLLENLEEPCHYMLQQVEDPEGDCGISFAMIVENKDAAMRFTQGLAKEGLEIGSAYNDGFPDRHIYSYWDCIIQKKGATDRNYPWNDPEYKGSAEYHNEICPRTLNILSRCLRLAIHMRMGEQNMLEIAEAINKVDKSL